MKRIIPFLFTLSVLCAQQPAQFSANSQLVMVDVQATEKGTGRILELLSPRDFEIYDDGNLQQIREFHFETTSLDVVFLKYGENGMGSRDEMNDFLMGLNNAVLELRPGDRAAVLSDDSGAKPSSPMTEDKRQIRRALVFGAPADRRHLPANRRHLYDAVRAAIGLFSQPNDLTRRRSIVALTDDAEQHSTGKRDSVITDLLESSVTLNEVLLVSRRRARRIGFGGIWGPRVNASVGEPPPAGESLIPVVEATGGEAVPGDSFREGFPELIARLRLRYLLGFYARPVSLRQFHTIEVRLGPDAAKRFPNALIRARRGYYSEAVGSNGK